MHYTNIGDDVWLGDYKSCNAHLQDFPLSIHLWRETNRHENRLCERVKNNTSNGLAVYWREGEPLDTLSVPFPSIMNYASRSGNLLIHCAGGVCRSPTIAVAVKVARGTNRYQAIADVYRGMWEGYRQTPEFYHKIFNDMFKWFDCQQTL